MVVKISEFLKKNYGVLIVLVIALAVRIIYLRLYHNLPDWNQLTVDNYYHHNWAISIVNGNIFGDTTYFRAPFYIYCLAIFYKLLGISLWTGRIFGLIVGLLSILFTYKIGKKVFNKRVGLISALIQSFYPICIYFESELLLDPLFTLLLQISLYYFLKWWEDRTFKNIFFCGIFLGFAAITRPTVFIIIPVIIVFIFLLLKAFKIAYRHSIILLLGTFLIILPIFLRNIIVAHDPVLIASQGGINFYIGNNDAADGVSAILPEPLGFNWRIQQITHIAEVSEHRSLKPGEVSSFWLHKTLRWITKHPYRFFQLYLQKLYHNFSNREISNNRDLKYFFKKIPLLKDNPLSFGIIFAFAVVGFIYQSHRNKKAVFLTVIILSYVIVSSIFFFSSRFRLPLIPFYIILASFMVYQIPSLLKKKWPTLLLLLLFLYVTAFFSFYPLVKLPRGNPSQHLLSQGLYYSSCNNYKKALELFKKANRIDPLFPETDLDIGVAYLKLGQTDSAQYYFRQETKKHPLRTKAYTNLASLYFINNHINKALQKIKYPLKAKPYDVVSNMVYLRALFYDSLIDKQTFKDTLFQVIARVDNNIYLLNDITGLLLEQNNKELSEQLLLKAIKSSPPPIETDDEAFERNFKNSLFNWTHQKAYSYYQLGYLNGLKGLYDKSITYSKKAIALDSNLVEAYINLISGYNSSGQKEKAKIIFNTAIKKFPTNPLIGRMKNILFQ